MKVLLTVAHRGVYTGGPHQLISLAKGLVEQGHEVVAAFKLDPKKGVDPSLSKLTDMGVRVELFRFSKLKYAYTIPELLKFRKFLKREKFDVVHSFKGTDFDYIILAGLGIRIPAVIVTRGNGMPLDFFNSLKYRMTKVKRIMTVSEAVRQLVISSGHVAPDKVVTVYGGIDLARFNPDINGAEIKNKLKIPNDVPVVGIIGSIQFEPKSAKGGYWFARAARKVLDAAPETRFVLVGDISVKKFKPLGEELGLMERFIFTGYRGDVPELLSAMDITVCASIRGEGLMGTVRESLAMRKPVVSTDVGGNREMVQDGITGFVVPVKDPDAMADKILYLIRNPEIGRQMGKAGRDIVEELADNKKRVEKILSVYQSCLNETY